MQSREPTYLGARRARSGCVRAGTLSRQAVVVAVAAAAAAAAAESLHPSLF